MQFIRTQRRSDSEENPYWISFSDLMSALLVVFLLAVVVLVLQLTKEQERLRAQEERAAAQQELFSGQIATLAAAEDARARMVRGIAQNLDAQGISVTVNDDHSVLSIPTEEIGFDASSYEIHPQHRANALRIGTEIGNALRSDGVLAKIDTVFVEGHTDNRKFAGLEGGGNWGLSTRRAISLWMLWEEGLPDEARLDTLQRPDGSPLFSVSGYGETRPVTEKQSTDEQRARNRRIDIRFTVVGPTAEDLNAIVEAADG